MKYFRDLWQDSERRSCASAFQRYDRRTAWLGQKGASCVDHGCDCINRTALPYVLKLPNMQMIYSISDVWSCHDQLQLVDVVDCKLAASWRGNRSSYVDCSPLELTWLW